MAMALSWYYLGRLVTAMSHPHNPARRPRLVANALQTSPFRVFMEAPKTTATCPVLPATLMAVGVTLSASKDQRSAAIAALHGLSPGSMAFSKERTLLLMLAKSFQV